MTTQQAKKISIAAYLETIGHYPKTSRKNGNELWYLSPLREETTPSFKITISKNSWYDFGLEQGGSILDFVIAKYGCSVGDAFGILSRSTTPKNSSSTYQIKPKEVNQKCEIRSIKNLQNRSLTDYIKSRKINIEIARRYLKEIYYRRNETNYFAVGIQNISSGYEVRCSIFKGSVGTKDITFLKGCVQTQISIFEGFFDFLSLLTEQNIMALKTDVVLLHSTVNLSKAMELMKSEKYTKIYAFFDNDDTGNNAFGELKKQNIEVKDMRYLYTGFNDYNDKINNQPIGYEKAKN